MDFESMSIFRDIKVFKKYQRYQRDNLFINQLRNIRQSSYYFRLNLIAFIVFCVYVWVVEREP